MCERHCDTRWFLEWNLACYVKQIINSDQSVMATSLTTRQQLEQNGFCIVPLVSETEAQEWKKHVKRLESQRQGVTIDPSTKSTVDPADTGINVWMTETGDFPTFFLQKLANKKLRQCVEAFFPCTEHAAPSRTPSVQPVIELLSCKPVSKSKKVAHPSPWHQDWVYWFGAPKVSAWIALDNATIDNGCLRVIPGSHKFGLVPHEQFQERIGFDRRIPDDVVESLCQKHQCTVVDVPIPAGHAIIFSDLLLHSSNANVTGADRYSLIPTYRDQAAKDESRVWKCGASFSAETDAFVVPALHQQAKL